MTYHLAVCDDIPTECELARKQLECAVERCDIAADVNAFHTGQECIDYLREHSTVDLLFLDIDMPEMDGLNVARQIRSFNETLLIVFLTSHAEYVYDSFEVQPFRFIRKDRMDMELFLAVQAAAYLLESRQEKFVTLRTEEGKEQVAISSIIYAEILNRKLHYFLRDGRELVESRSIQKLLHEMGNDPRFVLLDSGLLLNVDYERAFTSRTVTLRNGMVLPIARTRNTDVKNAIIRKRSRGNRQNRHEM